MSLTEDQKKKLNASLAPSDVSTREQGAKTLSFIEGWRAIDKMNDIIGPGCWSYSVPAPRLVVDEERDGGTDRYGKPKGMRWHVTYVAGCELRVGDAVICDWGAGHGIDKDRGIAHESAIKEAATDALKRCLKSLGRSMGLALYDKEQEHVADPGADEGEIGAVLALMVEAKSPADLDKARAAWKRIAPTATPEQRERITSAGVAAKKRLESA